jgi:hypothetical protein
MGNEIWEDRTTFRKMEREKKERKFERRQEMTQ